MRKIVTLLVTIAMVVSLSSCNMKDVVVDTCIPIERESIVIDSTVISIVFEGGYKTDYTEAYPIMQERGYKGTTYIVGSRIGFKDYLNWQELGVLVSNGWDVGTAGYTGADMSKLNECQIQSELNRDIEEISHQLCYRATSIVAPYDNVSSTLVAVAKSNGIEAILSSNPYPNGIVRTKVDGFNYLALVNTINSAKVSTGWVIVSFSQLKYCCNPDSFRSALNIITSSGLQVATVGEVLNSKELQ